MKNKQLKKIILDERGRKTKEGLKDLGALLQKKARPSQNRFYSRLEELYETTPKNNWNKVKYFLKRPLILTPLAGLAIFLLFAIGFNIYTTKRQRFYDFPIDIDSPIHSKLDLDSSGSGLQSKLSPAGLDQLLGEESIGLSHSAPTFKEKFLNALGRHQASPYDIAKRGPLLEKDLNIEIMTVKKSETQIFLQNTIKSLGGYVQKIQTDKYYRYSDRRGRLTVYGKVPAKNLESLRMLIKDFAGDDKYYREDLSAESRTADVIEIENKIKEVEKSIAYLEGAIARENDPAKKAALVKKLDENKTYLRERENTKTEVEEHIDFADVRITAAIMPEFWKASSLDDFRALYIGFEEPTLLDTLKINATQILVISFKIFSYTFWIIPILIWYFIKKRREKELLWELE